MDLQEIVGLMRLLTSSVENMVSLSNDSGKPLSASDPRLRKDTLQIVAAASQVISLVRSPEQYVLDTAMAVSILYLQCFSFGQRFKLDIHSIIYRPP